MRLLVMAVAALATITVPSARCQGEPTALAAPVPEIAHRSADAVTAAAGGAALRLERPALPLDPAGAPPAPQACDPATEDWCAQADGAGIDSVIFLDTRFEEVSIPWTVSGGWRLNDYATCAPGASGGAGVSAYVGDTACSYAPATTSSLLSPPFGPVTSASWFTFTSRLGLSANDSTLILVNGQPYVTMPPGLDPALWYSFNPISLATWAGLTVQLEFRFTSRFTPQGPGWFVDDVFAWDENGAESRCVREARADAGGPRLADCSDAVLDRWTFDENEFCVGCPYTFYALVECGTEMHLPLSDMEGADIAVSEVLSGTTPALTCRNDAARFPASPPVVLETDCCASPPGPERWTGPAWSATDNAGPGRVSWGFPDCLDLFTAYDSPPGDGVLTCAELSPPCGGTLDRLSPGELQGMDCSIAGNPGLCGIYRIDVQSGGNVWELFANCSGDTLSGFRIFHSCADALAAFNPLPELALSDLVQVGDCPGIEVGFTVANLGCADHPGEIRVQATSDCPSPDRAELVLGGGLAANQTRAASLPITLSCVPANVTLRIDPLDTVLECSESGSSAACALIPGADVAVLRACGCGATRPPLPTTSLVCAGLPTDLSCGVPEPGATYEWDFEDDGVYDAVGCDQTHIYPGPGPYQARVRLRTPAGCTADATAGVDLTADAPLGEPVLLFAVKALPGLELSWPALAGASSYRVARGTIGGFYDHTVDGPAGIGACDTARAVRLYDPDDLRAPESFYYLAAPISNCGTAGPWGSGRDATPGPIPSASCP